MKIPTSPLNTILLWVSNTSSRRKYRKRCIDNLYLGKNVCNNTRHHSYFSGILLPPVLLATPLLWRYDRTFCPWPLFRTMPL